MNDTILAVDSTIPLRITDAGRNAAGLRGEQKDCTVRAFAVARNVPYIEAHKALHELGRRLGRGFKFRIVAEKRPDLFTRQQFAKGNRKRVKTLLRDHKFPGRYVFRITGHVFAVVDGIIHDNVTFDSLKNCIVTDIYTAV